MCAAPSLAGVAYSTEVGLKYSTSLLLLVLPPCPRRVFQQPARGWTASGAPTPATAPGTTTTGALVEHTTAELLPPCAHAPRGPPHTHSMFFLPTQPGNPVLPPPNGDMLTAISNALNALMSPTRPCSGCPPLAYPANMPSWDHSRATWLRILLHLIGDMHQPLHCAGLCGAAPYASLPTGDAGGNFIHLTTATSTRGSALHSYWDGGANLFTSLGIPNTTSATNDVVAAVAALIDNGEVRRIATTAMPVNLGSLMASVLSWSNESLALARGVAYAAPVDTAIKAGTTNVVIDGVNAPVFDAYQVRAQPVVMMQLQRAGGRLAALLNAVLTVDESPTPSDNVAIAPSAAPLAPDAPASPLLTVPPPPAPGTSASAAANCMGAPQAAPTCSSGGSNAVMAAAVIGWLVAIAAAIVTARLMMKQSARSHAVGEDTATMLELHAGGGHARQQPPDKV